MKRNTTIILVISAAAVALSAIGTTTASATCRRVIAGNRSNFNSRSGFFTGYTCYSKSAGEGGYSKISSEAPENIGAGLWCYRVEDGTDRSSYSDDKCNTASAGEGGYFRSKEAPGFFKGSGTGKLTDKVTGTGGTQVFTTSAGKVECKGLKITEGEAPLESTGGAGLGLRVQYENCKAFGLAATIDPANLGFDANGTLTVLENITVLATSCTVTMPSSKNQELFTVKYKNSGKEVEFEPNVSGITSSGTGAACTYGEESKGTYTGDSLVGLPGGTLEWD